MGKGDKKSKRGKIFAGSYGKSRPKKKNNKKSNENKENKDKE
jgi:30S ribosomal protein S31